MTQSSRSGKRADCIMTRPDCRWRTRHGLSAGAFSCFWVADLGCISCRAVLSGDLYVQDGRAQALPVSIKRERARNTTPQGLA